MFKLFGLRLRSLQCVQVQLFGQDTGDMRKQSASDAANSSMSAESMKVFSVIFSFNSLQKRV